MVQTYLSYSFESIEDFDKILNILVIKLATTVLTSDISLSLQALDILSNILEQHEDKIKPESKRILKKMIFHKDPRVSKKVMQLVQKGSLTIIPMQKEASLKDQ